MEKPGCQSGPFGIVGQSQCSRGAPSVAQFYKCVPIEEAPVSTYDPDAVHYEWHPGMKWPPEQIHRTKSYSSPLEDQAGSTDIRVPHRSQPAINGSHFGVIGADRLDFGPMHSSRITPQSPVLCVYRPILVRNFLVRHSGRNYIAILLRPAWEFSTFSTSPDGRNSPSEDC